MTTTSGATAQIRVSNPGATSATITFNFALDAFSIPSETLTVAAYSTPLRPSRRTPPSRHTATPWSAFDRTYRSTPRWRRARVSDIALSSPGHGLGDTELVRALDQRLQQWATALPKEPQDLWEALIGFDLDSKAALFAHCVAASLNAVYDPYNRRPRALAHADRLAEALDLDMAAAG